MGILSGNPKNEPMHYGEVYTTWMYLFTEQGMIASYQTLMNHTGDADLKKLIAEAINEANSECKKIKELLKHNGIALPPASPERPECNLEDIPAGARFTDPEIAGMLAMNSAGGLVTCSTIMGQSIREDIGLMFGQFHTSKSLFAAKVLQLNKEKGWLIPPPLHLDTPNNH